jgi:ATP-dependent DNA ligase
LWSAGSIPKARGRASARCCSPTTIRTGGWSIAGRVGAGIKQAELERLWRKLQPLAVPEMPLEASPPRSTRFGSPLVLSRVHWVRPQLVAEVKYLTWTGDNLLRQVVYEGLREDKPATVVRRAVPHPRS